MPAGTWIVVPRSRRVRLTVGPEREPSLEHVEGLLVLGLDVEGVANPAGITWCPTHVLRDLAAQDGDGAVKQS